ncbi:MAG: outer membrane protein assembly factor BamA, partial [Paracoccaceae bacterium]|nr:outer membrane protein assembly factor BamA [Paracoccaceae bacterium]
MLTIGLAVIFTPASAQNYSFSQVVVEGNDRIEPATIVKFAGISRGESISGAGLNDAFQRLTASGLFVSVELVPSGGTLIIRVVENPTINIVNFEGNQRIKDEDLAKIVKSQSRRVYSISQAEADAAAIVQGYAEISRL